MHKDSTNSSPNLTELQHFKRTQPQSRHTSNIVTNKAQNVQIITGRNKRMDTMDKI